MGERVAELLAELNEKNIRIEDLQVPYRKGINHNYYLFIYLIFIYTLKKNPTQIKIFYFHFCSHFGFVICSVCLHVRKSFELLLQP